MSCYIKRGIYSFALPNLLNMKNLSILLFNWQHGALIMTVVFGFVIVGLVGVVLLLMKTDKKKKEDPLP